VTDASHVRLHVPFELRALPADEHCRDSRTDHLLAERERYGRTEQTDSTPWDSNSGARRSVRTAATARRLVLCSRQKDDRLRWRSRPVEAARKRAGDDEAREGPRLSQRVTGRRAAAFQSCAGGAFRRVALGDRRLPVRTPVRQLLRNVTSGRRTLRLSPFPEKAKTRIRPRIPVDWRHAQVRSSMEAPRVYESGDSAWLATQRSALATGDAHR
jgi:hypothetical protein